MNRGVRRTFALFVALTLVLGSAAAAHAAPYTFVNLADSVRDNFNPNSFTCSSLSNRGDVAFRAGRTSADGLNSFDGIYRANADGTLTTIAEDPNRTKFGFLGNNPSMNDLGDVSFAANLAPGFEEAILRGDGKKLTTIATTTKGFNFFGFDTSINNSGEVAFKGELDNFVEGLFSGSGGKVITHYLNSTDASLDARPVRFGGNDSRPSINNLGDIAFDETIQPNFDSGIFAGRVGTFRTIAAPDPNVFVEKPMFNDGGTAAFYRSFTDATGQFVTAIVTGNGGPLTTVADTTGPFGSFGFRPPSINNNGDVAFLANLDDFPPTTGIFVGPRLVQDRVIETGDKLDGSRVRGLSFCEEGLNDLGQLAFIADLADPSAPNGFRTAVFRATPRS
ncbi:MAG TPA: choice-of-anchor tandem repeat NxxGxxAF-containing protein [Gaiellaceae bacterium]|jgi:hypothetical protein